MDTGTLRETSEKWFDMVRSSPIDRGLIHEVFACFLLLRWVDHFDTEQEAMAVFEERTYQPLLPAAFQWRQWTRLVKPRAVAERLGALANFVERSKRDATQTPASYLHVLSDPLREVLKVDSVLLSDLARKIDDLPYETPGERLEVLTLFDRVLADSRSTSEGEYFSPPSISRLVAALADPRPGDRIYDPCFGAGHFLVAAWQYAEGSRGEARRPGPLLEVSGIERGARAYLIGLVRMLLAGVDMPRLQMGDALERDALASPMRHGFDVVLADPPWGKKISGDYGREPGRYQHFPIASTDSVDLFIQHSLSQLKPRGRAVIVVPEGFLFRGGAGRDLRRSLIEAGQVEAVIGLPAGVYAPYTMLKTSLLVLRKNGAHGRLRMVDATPLFESRTGRKAPFIRTLQAQQLAEEVRRPELREVREIPFGVSEGSPGTGVLSRAIWDVSVEEIAETDWDLTPRRREKGGLEDLLGSLKRVLGDSGRVESLASVVRVMAGRAIKSSDLKDDPRGEQPIGYLRIRDITQGKIGSASSWLEPRLAETERRWAVAVGDVLLSKSGTIGKAALVRNGAAGAVASSGLYVLRPDQHRLDSGFLLAYLASPTCQNWLAARSRGAFIRHLNRAVLDELPIPLPPLMMQVAAGAQHRDSGTDVLMFLAQAAGTGELERLPGWLAELSSRVPAFAEGIAATPALGLLKPLIDHASTASRWLRHEQLDGQSLAWLRSLVDTLSRLTGVHEIPPGPSLLTVLQDAERGFELVLKQASGHLPIEAQASAIADKLRNWMRAAAADLMNRNEIRVRASVSELVAGGFAEFGVDLVNGGYLPLRALEVETSPDWGGVQSPYLAERDTLRLNLRGDVPRRAGNLSLQLRWRARNLNGEQVNGNVELAVRVVESTQSTNYYVEELGSSPYVTGSPLDPKRDQSVFFGRQPLIEQIKRQVMTHGNVVLLEGNRRAGKTSILKYLEGSSAIPGWLAVYASLQGAQGDAQKVGVPTAEVFREMAQSIANAVTRLGMDTPLPNGSVIAAGKAALGVVGRACREGISEQSPVSDFRDYLEQVLRLLEQKGLGLLLMLDEFDKLQEGIESGITSPQVPENIRFFIQTYPKFSAILTGSRRLKRLREEYWSALYGLGTTLSVTALDEENARRVVTEPVRGKLVYSDEAVARVIALTARQPYLLQCLCNRIFDYAVETKLHNITLSVVESAARTLVRDNEHFASLWDYAAQGPKSGRWRRQLVLLLCTRSFKEGSNVSFGTLQEWLTQSGVEADDESLAEDLSYLRELELIELSGELGDGSYRLAIPLMADWISQQQDAHVVTNRARAEAEEENG